MANQDRGFLLSHARVSSKRHKGIKGDDIFNLFQQLSTMIQAGMPLMDALLLCAEQTQSKKLGAVMDAIAGKVQNGSSLWSAASSTRPRPSPTTSSACSNSSSASPSGRPISRAKRPIRRRR